MLKSIDRNPIIRHCLDHKDAIMCNLGAKVYNLLNTIIKTSKTMF